MRNYLNWNSILLASVFLFSSCSPVGLSKRTGKDIVLTEINFQQIRNTYSNIDRDTNKVYAQSALGTLTSDTTNQKKQLVLKVNSVNNKMLAVDFFSEDSLVSHQELHGKLKGGYFKVKSKWKSSFLLGPLVWVLGNYVNYIGLTKEEKLFILSSREGTLLLLCLPAFASGGSVEGIFSRLD